MSFTDDNPTESDSVANLSPTEDEAAPEGSAIEDETGDPEAPEPGADGEADVSKLREENSFLLDQLQRSRAELENFRRRTAEGRRAQGRRFTADLFRRVLPLFDDLNLALNSDTSDDKLSEGVRIIVDGFQRVLTELQIEVVEAVGHPFDPAVHEAMFQEETDAVPDGQVMEEFERGYRIGEELIRPARVKVAKAPALGDDEGEP